MIGIIGAMEDEVAFLRNAMEEGKTTKTGEFVFYSGKLEGKPVVLLRCGIGKVNAAVGCALLINAFKPDFVLNTGSAGGMEAAGVSAAAHSAAALQVGDAVISTGLVYHDVDLTAFSYVHGQLPGQPPVFPVDEALIVRATEAVNELKEEKLLPEHFNCHQGLIGSGDIFMHEPERIAAARKLFPEMMAVEMEGAAIAHCCRLFSIPALVIRALSDIAGTESPVAFTEFLPVASKHSAEIVQRIIRKS